MIKSIHLIAVASTIILFLVRYVWMIFESPMLQKKWVKVFPHVIDTILLISAVGLATQLSQYPFVDGWLSAKVMALLIYIVLGSVALKRGKTKVIRVIAGLVAMGAFAYMLSVAITKNSMGFFVLVV